MMLNGKALIAYNVLQKNSLQAHQNKGIACVSKMRGDAKE